MCRAWHSGFFSISATNVDHADSHPVGAGATFWHLDATVAGAQIQGRSERGTGYGTITYQRPAGVVTHDRAPAAHMPALRVRPPARPIAAWLRCAQIIHGCVKWQLQCTDF